MVDDRDWLLLVRVHLVCRTRGLEDNFRLAKSREAKTAEAVDVKTVDEVVGIDVVDGPFLPCCFSSSWNSNDSIDRDVAIFFMSFVAEDESTFSIVIRLIWS